MVAASGQTQVAPCPARHRPATLKSNKSASDKPSTPPRQIAMSFAHQLLDFQLQVRSFLLENDIDLNNQESVLRFVASLGNDPTRLEITRLVTGTFSDIERFAHAFVAPSASLENLDNCEINACPPSTPNNNQHDAQLTYAAAARRPAAQVSPQSPSVRMISGFPPLRASQTSEQRQFDMDAVRLKHRGDQAVRRAGLTLVGHEEKAFAMVSTPDDARPFSKPGALRNVWRVANIIDPMTILPTTNPRRILVCASRSTLSLLQTGYDRFKTLNRHQQMPTIQVQMWDPGQVGANTSDIRSLLKTFKEEISRLRSQDLRWGPRFYFAQYIRGVHNDLAMKLREIDPNANECPLPPFMAHVQPAITDIEPQDMVDDEAAPTSQPRKRAHQESPRPPDSP